MIKALRIGTAVVWLLFGVGFKVLDLVPRHRRIVASILGERVAGTATVLIGVAEAGLALWILSGVRPRLCVVAQTVAIVTMNTLELAFARDLLLAPVPMLCANVLFLGVGWYCALRAPDRRP